MIAKTENMEQACRQIFSDFFAKYPNPPLQNNVELILKLLLESGIPKSGKPAGWAGGIIYAVTNYSHFPCGIPGLLNEESEEFFHVSMDTIRKRATKITPIIEALMAQALS